VPKQVPAKGYAYPSAGRYELQQFQLGGPRCQSLGYPVDMLSPLGTQTLPTLKSDPNCHLRYYNSGSWLHDCGLMPGASGGPITATNSKGDPIVAAIHVAGQNKATPQQFNSYGANVGAPVEQLRLALMEELRGNRLHRRIPNY